jgi:hypothetical protein
MNSLNRISMTKTDRFNRMPLSETTFKKIKIGIEHPMKLGF